MQNKIAVEEHYDLPPITAAGKNAFRQSYLDDVQDRLHNRTPGCGKWMPLASVTR